MNYDHQVGKSASKTEQGLNLRQEEFCKLFAGEEDRDFLGNGTQCYLEVYGFKDDETGRKISYLTAKANASRLLTNANICKRINELLETAGFTDENTDKQHLFLLNQYADLKSKLGAVKEYNALKSRIQKRIDVTSGGKPIGSLIDELNGTNTQTKKTPSE